MLVNGNAATVITNGYRVVGIKANFNPIGVSCDGFIHRVIKNFANQMVQGAFICAADIHAGALANRFQSFKDFDRRSVIICGVLC